MRIFEIDANLTHDSQGVDQLTSNLKADVSKIGARICRSFFTKILEIINIKYPSKADVIEWTEIAWENIVSSYFVNVAVNCYYRLR